MRSRLLILLLATLLHLIHGVDETRFHPDEAYFMTFARNAAVNGDWMLGGSLDKPPLSIYLSAISMVLIGNTTDANGVLHLDPLVGEFAGRLPNIFFAIALVAVMMRLAHDLYHDGRTTLWTGVLTATSPYVLAFGATAFTDMSLLFFLTLALWLVVRGQLGWSGIALGLAFWSKQQALFYVPLVFVARYIIRIHWQLSIRRTGQALSLRYFGGVITIIFLLIWDAIRPETSIFLLGTINNTPDSLLADPSLYMPRLVNWAYWGAWLMGHPVLTSIIVCVALIGWGWHMKKREAFYQWDSLFGLYIVGYIGLHTILAFNQYDRYLLLILPSLILLCARGLNTSPLHRIFGYFVGTVAYPVRIYRIVICLLILSAIYLSHIGIPIGGDKGDYHGIDDLANYLNDKPIATVVYDRWLGWELGYYMGQWTNKRRVHFPTPQALVDGALALDELGDRYLVAPIDQPITKWLDGLEAVGFTTQIDYQSERFIVYRLLVPASDA